ncbi:MAG TPA: hypothetical protein VHW06_18200 [Streptosporangiaceae bacterium]|nr:hypothetical protein [Streptosporangiaceae bacterium]
MTPRTLPARLVSATAAATLVVAAVAGLPGCGSGTKKPVAHGAAVATPLGSYPSYLPRDTLNQGTDSVLTGTAQHPALTNEGDPVKVKTAHWSVLVTVTGPQVPGEGLPFQANADTATWVVTLSDATGTVPVSAADFTAIDDQNNLYKPGFVPGQPKPAATLKPGQKASFELRAVEATGEGLMRWAPDGHNIVAKWDFVVEND